MKSDLYTFKFCAHAIGIIIRIHSQIKESRCTLTRLFYMLSCQLQTVTVSFLPFQYGFLFSLCLMVVPRTSKLHWIHVVRVGILDLFLILEETLSALHYWVWCWVQLCHIRPLLCWGWLPLCLVSGGFLSGISVGFCQKLFLHLLNWSYVFYSSVCSCDISHWLI